MRLLLEGDNIMKNMTTLLLIVILVTSLALSGCASSTPATEPAHEPSAETIGSNEAPAEESTAAAPSGFVFDYNGTVITIHSPAEPILTALGEPLSYTEQPSCAFEGMDKTYSYGSFYIDTYTQSGTDFIYSVWFADDTVTTQEGLYIGASQSTVEAIYGTENFDGDNSFTITKGDTTLLIILEGTTVSSIQYMAG